MDYQSSTLNLAIKQASWDALTQAKAKADELVAALSGMQATAATDLHEAQMAIATSTVPTVGLKSSVTTRAEEERIQGQGAAIDAIKADPAITAEAAIAAWRAGVVLPAGRTMPLHDPAALLEEYAANALAAGAIQDTTWDSFRALVVATDKALLMSM